MRYLLLWLHKSRISFECSYINICVLCSVSMKNRMTERQVQCSCYFYWIGFSVGLKVQQLYQREDGWICIFIESDFDVTSMTYGTLCSNGSGVVIFKIQRKRSDFNWTTNLKHVVLELDITDFNLEMLPIYIIMNTIVKTVHITTYWDFYMINYHCVL